VQRLLQELSEPSGRLRVAFGFAVVLALTPVLAGPTHHAVEHLLGVILR